jgi:hypothetical protein
MKEFIEVCLSGPRLPATILLGIVVVYWVVALLGALDVELFDFDLDVGADADGSIFHLGLVSFRWLNLGEVPVMIWMSVFTLSFWIITLQIDRDVTGLLWYQNLGIVARNVGLAILATKVITQPLRGKLTLKEPTRADELIGKRCVIQTESNEQGGQAQYKTDAAPLYLNVKTTGGTLEKGVQATIVDYDPATNVYFVQAKNEEAS